MKSSQKGIYTQVVVGKVKKNLFFYFFLFLCLQFADSRFILFPLYPWG